MKHLSRLLRFTLHVLPARSPIFEIVITGLITLAVGVPIGFILHRVSRRTFEREEAMRANWQRLAAKHRLSFIRGRYRPFGASEVAYVEGIYRGRYLKLDSIEQLREEPGQVGGRTVSTRLVLSVIRHPAQPVVPPIDTDAGIISPKTMGQLLTAVDLSALKGRVSVEAQGTQISYEQARIETDVAYLDWLLDVLDKQADSYAQIVALGGQAAPALEVIIKFTTLDLQNTATQLLQGIAADTAKRLSHRLDRLLCPHCLAHCQAHRAAPSHWQTITYYGCRICNQSRDFLEGQPVAVLNRQMDPPWLIKADMVQVNWLTYRKLFDFNAVLIVQATDEEVERLAVQVGNDTDPYRRPRYNQIACTISPTCRLSENTLRILQRTFGQLHQA